MTVKTAVGAITATKPVLNSIALAYYSGAYRYEREGAYGMCRYYRKIGEQIHDALEVTGYYMEDK